MPTIVIHTVNPIRVWNQIVPQRLLCPLNLEIQWFRVFPEKKLSKTKQSQFSLPAYNATSKFILKKAQVLLGHLYGNSQLSSKSIWDSIGFLSFLVLLLVQNIYRQSQPIRCKTKLIFLFWLCSLLITDAKTITWLKQRIINKKFCILKIIHTAEFKPGLLWILSHPFVPRDPGLQALPNRYEK